MALYVIGFHDGWMHHPVAAVESEAEPTLADPDKDWLVELTDGDIAYMAEENITALEYIIDLAYDGQLSDATGMHEPFMDGEPRWEWNDDIMRMWEEMQHKTTDSINGHRGGAKEWRLRTRSESCECTTHPGE